MEKQAKKLNKDIVFPSVIIFTILVLLLFVCPFSPIHRYCFETDEIAYRVVSKGLLKGKIPYRDLFDHKGPSLFRLRARHAYHRRLRHRYMDRFHADQCRIFLYPL